MRKSQVLPAGAAGDDMPRWGDLSQQSDVRQASFRKPPGLPDFIAPPPEEVRDTELTDSLLSYPPYSQDNDDEYSVVASEQVVVPVPPPPPGLIKRLMNRLGCGDDEVTEPLLIEAPYFSSTGEVATPDRWWTSFGNEDLDRQIDYSLNENLTLVSAFQRLRQAEAVTRREASDLFPDLNGVSTAEQGFSSFDTDDGLFTLGLDASYQVDLWGQIESRVDAERLRASATAEDYQAIALTLSAEIARAWFSLIEAYAQLELLEEQLETNALGLKLQETRFRGGDDRVGSADVLRQQQLVESTREQMVIARSRVDVLEHQLAVLQGRPPQDATYDVGSTLPNLQPLPLTGLPSELIHRRPDVRRDYLAMLAADRDLASAITDRYPRLDLGGSLTTLATRSTNLFQDWIFIIGGQLFAPIFDGGQRRAEIDRTDAVVRELVAEYGQTVLVAFQEVENALALEYYQTQRIESLEKQYDLAKQASKELRDRYFGFGEEIGETEYLDVLTATTTEQRLQRDLVSAKLDLILTRISLYLALAGGFDPNPQLRFSECPPQTVLDEQPAETANNASLDTDPDLDHRLPRNSRRGGSGDRGDQSDPTDRTTDRSDAEVSGAR
ncbi:TolC family protein [Thalassoroseus pseudoceratinae]|uniref:TolC family protein n=1 Tax=Thalassoroseus pseudoceratinae TaxID=2713176 RepID=UPI001F0DAFA7|nr:TolC family protein [Thalassoroseus pseudoceratinae]